MDSRIAQRVIAQPFCIYAWASPLPHAFLGATFTFWQCATREVDCGEGTKRLLPCQVSLINHTPPLRWTERLRSDGFCLVSVVGFVKASSFVYHSAPIRVAH